MIHYSIYQNGELVTEPTHKGVIILTGRNGDAYSANLSFPKYYFAEEFHSAGGRIRSVVRAESCDGVDIAEKVMQMSSDYKDMSFTTVQSDNLKVHEMLPKLCAELSMMLHPDQ